MNLIEFANSHPIVTTLCYCASVAYTLVCIGLLVYIGVLYARNEREGHTVLWDEE